LDEWGSILGKAGRVENDQALFDTELMNVSIEKGNEHFVPALVLNYKDV
jgi:hypothetical protein